MEEKYLIGKQVSNWQGGIAQSLTFIVTEDCNLRCKYCYITHKASNRKMNIEVAEKFIDYLFENKLDKQPAVTLDFIGGEPFLEIDLIDKICDYFKIKSYQKNSSWFWNYRISICTNGVNYSDKRIQKFLDKNRDKVGVTITIDGTKKKHDMQRVFPDGTGSYDIIKRNVDIWLKKFSGSTKVTFASDDLCCLKDSIIELYNMGIHEIAANVVFEDVWKEGDDLLFESQLKELADYVIENKLYDKFICSLFDDSIGHQYDKENLKKTSCGAGKMLALGVDGKIFPCMRYCAYSLNNKKEYCIGDVNEGIDFEKLRPFQSVSYEYQSDEECLNCPVATGCSFCQGFNYDEAHSDTIFERAKYICKMHKARVRANNYYFARLKNEIGISVNRYYGTKRKMFFLLSDSFVSCCQMSNPIKVSRINLRQENIILGLQYAYENFYKPIFVHSRDKYDYKFNEIYNKSDILHVLPADYWKEAEKDLKEYLLVFDEKNINIGVKGLSNCILNIEQENIGRLSEYIHILLHKTDRININITDINKFFDFKQYQESLEIIKDEIISYLRKDIIKEINILTDIFFEDEQERCDAGISSFALSPNGEFYICPNAYVKNTMQIGDLKSGVKKLPNSHLLDKKYAVLCKVCDNYQCNDCIMHNLEFTSEVNIPSSIQCKKSYIERNVSLELQKDMINKIKIKHHILKTDYDDTMVHLQKIINNEVN
ncbi:MAG: radical SAM peptide maturase, CXXX-repeat target family [Lachnospiraceae bacterium]|nr:radical SAM peptide maturase, CXXX-repeat target family [Lachnospiraceae bacterium]